MPTMKRFDTSIIKGEVSFNYNKKLRNIINN